MSAPLLLEVQGRPQAVFGAFAAFRQRRCQPYQPDVADEAMPPPSGISRSSSKESTVVGLPGGEAAAAAALADRLVTAAEVLHILRPVVYALALRRCREGMPLMGAAAVGSCTHAAPV